MEVHPIAAVTTESIHVDGQNTARTLPNDEIKKLHVHLGHANKLALVRTLKAAKIKVDLNIVDAVLEDFPCGVSRRDQIQPPAVGPHRALWAGHTVMADLRYPVGEDALTFPYVIAIEKSSRFALTGLMGNISVISTIDLFNSRWVAIFGRPIRLIMDKGPGLVGEQWGAYTSVCNIAWISNPMAAPFHGGVFERCIGVSKYAAAAVKRGDPNCSWGEAATAACVGRNLSPMLESG